MPIAFLMKYRIKLSVIDDSDCVCFVVFDKETKQVLEKSCIEILDPILLDIDYTGGLLPTSKASSIIEGEKVEGVKEPVRALGSLKGMDSKVPHRLERGMKHALRGASEGVGLP
ncbi:hypothetical protein Ahy_A01g000856 [Arachis hypogaea]|uniref:Replication factor A C-terminal domain-containing protein n=1 Tax=Arachis hypogaea TaxID=3818 RepID=A0A445ELD0_ARAHY|nr:hypothetical protein Ahy_A01g000856 [Arachis hypogaea]